MQVQIATNDDLEDEIDRLQKENASLKAEIEALKAGKAGASDAAQDAPEPNADAAQDAEPAENPEPQNEWYHLFFSPLIFHSITTPTSFFDVGVEYEISNIKND